MDRIYLRYDIESENFFDVIHEKGTQGKVIRSMGENQYLVELQYEDQEVIINDWMEVESSDFMWLM